MTKKAGAISLKRSDPGCNKIMRLQLDSGRQVLTHSNENGEFIEIVEPKGEIVLRVQMTENGPLLSFKGAHLVLQATESIALEAKKVTIQATEKAAIQSKGSLEIDASQKINIHSEDDIRAAGKMIFLN